MIFIGLSRVKEVCCAERTCRHPKEMDFHVDVICLVARVRDDNGIGPALIKADAMLEYLTGRGNQNRIGGDARNGGKIDFVCAMCEVGDGIELACAGL